MSEKNTDYIMLSKYNQVFKHEYNTNGNKLLFNNKRPDGWDIINNKYLIIIENKQKFNKKYYNECLEQIKYYYNIAIKTEEYKLNQYIVYLIMGFGNNEESFKYYILDETLNLTNLNLQTLYNIVGNSNIKHSFNIKKIHSLIVQYIHCDKTEDLHNILIIITLSFLNTKLIEYYEKQDDKNIISSEFVELLIKNAKEHINNSSEYEKYFDMLTKTNIDNCYNICKIIYKSYLEDNYYISKLFQQFKNFKGDKPSKNEIWTEDFISSIMFKEIEKYCDKIIKDKKQLIILDPCIGVNNLIKPILDKYRNISNNVIIKGTDIKSNYVFTSKLDLLSKSFNADYITTVDDFITNFNKIDLNNNVCICNPPYTEAESGHKPIEFIDIATNISDICCFIFPLNQFKNNNTKQYRDNILNNHYIHKIINLGSKIFIKPSGQFAGTGDIAIIVTINKQKYKYYTNKEYNNTEYYDLSLFGNNRYKERNTDNVIDSEEGKQLLNNYLNNKVKPELYKIENNKYLYDNSDNNINELNEYYIDSIINNIKEYYINKLNIFRSNLIEYSNYINDDKHILLNTDKEYIEKQKIIEDIKNINIEDINVKDIIQQINTKQFKQYKLNELFEEIKCKKYNEKRTSEGNIPFYGATKENKPIKYVNELSYDTELSEDKYIKQNGIITINKDGNGGAGYCFRRKGKISVNSHVKLYKELNNIYLDDINLKFISCQLHKIFSFHNSINNERFDNSIIYILINDNLIHNDEKQKIIEDIKNINIEDINVKDIIQQINTKQFKQYKLNELFEEIKCKKYYEKYMTDGNIPLYSSSCIDKVLKYVNELSYDTELSEDEYIKHNGVITINRNGSVGYCFRRKGKFAITQDVKLYKELNNIYLDDINLKFISCQLHKIFSFSNKITSYKFNDLNIYILVDKDNNIDEQYLNNIVKEFFNNNEYVINEQIDTSNIIQQINTKQFKQYKLNELFEEIKCKKYNEKRTSEGNIPFYGATKENKPIKYVNELSYDTELSEDKYIKQNGIIRINKHGSAGYCFRHKGKLSINSTTGIYKELNNIYLDDINLKFISCQLHKIFNFNNILNNERFNNTEVYIIINNNEK